MFQSHYLLPEFTAVENVAMPALIQRRDRTESLKHARELLERVGLGARVDHRPGELSGGEAQRVKLSTELGKKDTGKTFYILDEPTTGLHFQDIQHLVDVLNKLVDRGNTVLVIEHNMDIIKIADHIIDLGPEGGDGGGRILFEGTPEELAKNKESYTAKFLKEELAGGVNHD